MWWGWGLLGYALGKEEGRNQGRTEGLQEAKRRIDGDDTGAPRINRAQQRQPPPPPPRKGHWIMAVIIGALILGVGITIDEATFQNGGGNYTFGGTLAFDQFASMVLGLFRLCLYLFSLVPLVIVAQQYFASRSDGEPSGRFHFTEDPK